MIGYPYDPNPETEDGIDQWEQWQYKVRTGIHAYEADMIGGPGVLTRCKRHVQVEQTNHGTGREGVRVTCPECRQTGRV